MSAVAAPAIDDGLAPGVTDAACLVLEFVSSDGRCTRGPLASMWSVRFETHPPVRSVRTFKGQRNFDGLCGQLAALGLLEQDLEGLGFAFVGQVSQAHLPITDAQGDQFEQLGVGLGGGQVVFPRGAHVGGSYSGTC